MYRSQMIPRALLASLAATTLLGCGGNCPLGQKLNPQGMCVSTDPSPSPPSSPSPPPETKPPKLPDLTVTGINFWASQRNGIVALCLNKNALTDAAVDHGDYVGIKNAGTEAAGPYKSAYGLHSASAGTFYTCSGRLEDNTGLSAGAAGTWKGPLCCYLSVPPGDYRMFVFADIDKSVIESDENNGFETNGGIRVTSSLRGDEQTFTTVEMTQEDRAVIPLIEVPTL